MANELNASYFTGITGYFQLFNAIGQVRNTVTTLFEAPQDANIANYDIAATEAGTTGIYRADMPVIVAGVYYFLFYEQAGGVPAVGDAPAQARGQMQWDGTAELPLSTLPTAVEIQTVILSDATPFAGANVDAAISTRATPAQVNAQVDIALSDIDLDHLIQVAAGAETPTIDSYIDQIMNANASQTFDPTTDSLEAIRNVLQSSSITVTSAVVGSAINITRGDTLSAAITGMGDLTGYVSLDWTVKESSADTDANSIIWIRDNATGVDDGLLRFNKAAGSPATDGSITIDDLTAGDITIVLSADQTVNLAEAEGLEYDIQMITATAVSTLTTGKVNVGSDITRAIV